MNLSIYDTAENISWIEDKKDIPELKGSKYELLVDYLNAGLTEIIKPEDREDLQARCGKLCISEQKLSAIQLISDPLYF